MAETKKTSLHFCKSCIYSTTMSATSTTICDYFMLTGNRRGCKVGECDKYEKGKRKKNAFKL